MRLQDMDPRAQSARRWQRLSTCLAALEHVVEGASRLDAYEPPSPVVGEDHDAVLLVSFNAHLFALEQRLDREIDRVTAALLLAHLDARKCRDLATSVA
jgi:hypothetical protein